MKLFMLNSVNYGSTGRIAAGLCRYMCQRGADYRFAFGRGIPRAEGEWRFGGRPALAAHVARTRLSDRHGFGSAAATRRLVAEAQRFAPTVIHQHNLHGYYVNLPIWNDYLRQVGRPVIWTMHDCWAFTGHCAHFEDAGCNRYRTGCHDCPQRHRYPASQVRDASRRNYADKRALFTGLPWLHIVTPSVWLADRVGESFLSAYPVTVIPNGIDRTVFRPAADEQRAARRRTLGLGPDDKLVLGVAGRWERAKGLRFLASLAGVLGEGYCVAALGAPGGTGGIGCPQQDASDERHPRLRRLPPTDSPQELAAWYAAADVFVNPTVEDTFPTTNLEALACGRPVATFATGGSPESVDTDTGRVVVKGDVAALAQAVRDLCAQETGPLWEACTARAARLYDEHTMWEHYARLYDRVQEEEERP